MTRDASVNLIDSISQPEPSESSAASVHMGGRVDGLADGRTSGCADDCSDGCADSRTASSCPSRPTAYRSQLYIERGEGWDAHLKIDHDKVNPINLDTIRQFVRTMHEIEGSVVTAADVIQIKAFKTRKGHHVRIHFRTSLPRMPAKTILLMQAALGDDPMRQEMNTARVDRNEIGWNVLWHEKIINSKTVSAEEYDPELTASISDIFGLKQ